MQDDLLMQDDLINLILETAKEVSEQESLSIQNLSADTILYGDGGILDSMALVSLVIAVEQAIEDKYEQSVGLADEKAMSQSRSPYRSAARLAEYAASQLESD